MWAGSRPGGSLSRWGLGWARLSGLGGLGGGGEGDGVAEGLELVDEVAGSAGLVDAGGVVVGAEVVEPGGGVGEQVPDDDEDGAGDGDEGFEFAAAFDQTPVAFTEEGVG